MTLMIDDSFGADELARRYGKPIAVIYEWIVKGRFPEALATGRGPTDKARWKRAHILQWEAAQRRKPKL
jgi:predicted DNA-binding transcriptional regulator AlpA